MNGSRDFIGRLARSNQPNNVRRYRPGTSGKIARCLSWLAVIVAGCAGIPKAQAAASYMLAYPAAPYDTASATYTLKADRTAIPVSSYYEGRYSFGHLAFEGRTTFVVTIRSGSAITAFDISPHASGVSGKVSGANLTFSVTQAKSTYLILHMTTSAGQLEPLVIAGDPREADAPVIGRAVHDITAPPYNADKTGKTLLNTTIQNAIDAVSSGGGGTLYFPAGVYKISNNIRLASNITIYLAPGAFLRGSSNRDDYTWNTNGRLQNGQPAQGPQNFVIPGGVNNVAFTGRGMIDANSTVLATAASPERPVDGFGNYRKGIIHSNDRNGRGSPNGIKIVGITLKDATTWTLNIEDALNVTIQNVKMVNDFNWIHSDGYDLVSVSHAVVDNCLGITGDDVYNAKSGPKPLTDIVYSNNVAYSWKGTGTKVGVQAQGTAHNIVFRNIQIVAGQRAVSISHDEGSGSWSDLQFENIHMENIEGTSTSGQFLVAPIVIWTMPKGPGPVSGITLSHVTVDESRGFVSQIVGTSPEASISNVTLQDVTIDGTPINNETLSNKIKVGPNVNGIKCSTTSGGN